MEQFKADKQRSDGAVGDTAEHGNHAYSGTEGGREAQKTSEQAAESGACEEGGDDLTALEAGAEGCGGKNNF